MDEKKKIDGNCNADGVCKKTSIGGQALLEGIMMRGPVNSAMAVRNPDGEIVLEKWQTYKKPVPKFWKLPVFRGMYNMVSSLAVGYKCLKRSAEIAGLEDEPKKKKEESDTVSAENAENSAENKVIDEKQAAKQSKLMDVLMFFSVILGVGIAVLLFFYLPSILFNFVGWLFKIDKGITGYNFIRSLIEGVFKIAIFVIYLLLVSQMKDIKRTFMYHGAEHKTIFCYEKGLPLTVENVRKQTRFHPRCGTSFMIILLLISIIIGMFIKTSYAPLRAAIKLLLLPLTVGLGYELIKFAGRHDNLLVRIISAPGMWLQRITTKEPDDDMIECAIAAMNEVIPQDKTQDNW